MTRIAVAPDLFAKGVDTPREGRTFDWRAPVGSPENLAGVAAAYGVCELAGALAADYPTEARFVGYLVAGPDGGALDQQPRVNKPGLVWLETQGFTLLLEVLVADVAPAPLEQLPPTVAAYQDGRRLRVVQPLVRPIPIAEADAVTSGWLLALEQAGLHPLDPPDWTRHYRLPRTTRARRPVCLEVVGNPSPITPPAPSAPRPAHPTRPPLAAPPPGSPLLPASEASAAMIAALRRAAGVDGLTVLQAACGLGKSRAARTVAIERARKALGPGATGQRAPLHSKTSIAVPTNALAEEYVAALQGAGVPTARVFGALSLVAPDGTKVCKYHDVAAPLSEGGQSVRLLLCDNPWKPCEHRETCPARLGREGDEDARILVGSHGLLGELDTSAGTTGLLVIDEPPALLETVVLKVDEIADAEHQLDRGRFAKRYAISMAPAIRAVKLWSQLIGPLDTPGPLARAIEMGIDQELLLAAYELTGAEDAITAARLAFAPDHRGTAPPIEQKSLFRVRSAERGTYERQLAGSLGSASRVLGTLRRALLAPEGQAIVRIEDRGQGRILVVTLTNETFRRAVTRQGAVVLLDANADLHLPVLSHLVASPPPVHRFAAADGAPIRRTLYRTRSATRSGWFAHGRIVPSAGAVQAIEAAIQWALEDPASQAIGIIAPRLVELLLRGALGEDVTGEWRRLRQRDETLEETAGLLGSRLARLSHPPAIAHYGAIRGLDHWKDLDALITLSDPWPALGEVQLECDFLGLPGGWEARAEALCRAELEQAHGRLRTIHRTRPARALHVGAMLPGSWEAAVPPVEVREPPRGRPKNVEVMGLDELRAIVERLGGTSATALALGCSRSTLKTYLAGTVRVREAIARELRDLARSAPAEDEAGTPVAGKALSEISYNRAYPATSRPPLIGLIRPPPANDASDDWPPDPDPAGGDSRTTRTSMAVPLSARAPVRLRGPTAYFKAA